MILIIKHVFIEGPGIIGEFFKDNGHILKTIVFERNDRLSSELDEIEAVVIMGGPMNVYQEDKYPFLKQEGVFLKKLIKLEIPVLGICLGAQLIAKAYGAKVRKANYKEIGWHKVTLTKEGQDDVLFRELGKEIDVFQWHEDQFDLPEKGTLLADSNLCPQAFRIGKNIYGLQFHFEVTPQMIEEWFKEDAKEVTHGLECGIGVENFNDLKVGDVLESFVVEETAATLH